MSRRTWGIALAVLAVLAAAAALWYAARRDTAVPPQEQRGTELVEMLPAETRPDQVSQAEDTEESPGDTEEENVPEGYEYILHDHNGYVAVYKLPENEIYEYTDVIMEILPASLQEEIHDGKYLRNEEELYNFLENYTS